MAFILSTYLRGTRSARNLCSNDQLIKSRWLSEALHSYLTTTTTDGAISILRSEDRLRRNYLTIVT